MPTPPTVQLPLIRGDKNTKLDYRDNLPVNMTAVVRQVRGDDGYLVSHDGLTEFATTSGSARGGFYNERFGAHYRVSGDVFEEVNSDGTVTQIGLTAGDDICSFANSFNTQAILSDGKVWLWDNGSLNQIIDPELGVPVDITWFRGIYVMTDGEFLYHTDVDNEFSISPLKYSSSEFAADPIIGVSRNDQNQIVAFNRYSTEFFFFNPNAPAGTSVLQVLTGKAIRVGIVGTHCKVMMDGAFFILGGRKEESPSIYILNGAQPISIATREIDKIIGSYDEQELSKVFMESRVVDRDKFIIIHLRDYTLLYNHTVAESMGVNNAWSYVKSGVDIDEPWRAKFGVYDRNAKEWVYGDIKDNKLAILNQEEASQYGEQVESICYTPNLQLESMSIDKFEIDTIPGFSSSNFTGSFSMSYDNGVTYGKEHFNLISSNKDYTKRYIARRLGYVRDDFCFKFRFTSKDKMAFSNLSVWAS